MKALWLSLALLASVSCPPSPPNPQPTPTPTLPPTTTQPPETMTGPRCAATGLSCGCVDQPPGQLETCVVCDSSAPGGVKAIGFVPVCPPPAPTPPPTTTLPPSPPPATVCTFPQGVPEADFQGSPGIPKLGGLVNSVMGTVSGCQPGSSCPLPGWTQQSWQAAVAASLRKLGLCAGQHVNGVSDEIAVAKSCELIWEGYHVYAGPETGGGRVVWASIPSSACEGSACQTAGGGAYRGDTKIPARYCGSVMPTPQPPPTTLPSPAPPPQGECPIAGDGWFYDLKIHGGQQLDLTPYVANPTGAPNVPWSGCGTVRCPLSCEKGDVACACQRELFGDAVWSTANGTCNVFTTESSFTVKVAQGACTLFVKGSNGGTLSQGWAVTATVPACTADAGEHCR